MQVKPAILSAYYVDQRCPSKPVRQITFLPTDHNQLIARLKELFFQYAHGALGEGEVVKDSDWEICLDADASNDMYNDYCDLYIGLGETYLFATYCDLP